MRFTKPDQSKGLSGMGYLDFTTSDSRNEGDYNITFEAYISQYTPIKQWKYFILKIRPQPAKNWTYSMYPPFFKTPLKPQVMSVGEHLSYNFPEIDSYLNEDVTIEVKLGKMK